MDAYWKEFKIIEAREGRLLLCRYDVEDAKEYKVIFLSPKTVEIVTTNNYPEAVSWLYAIEED